jgi:hypothetical protein
MNEDNDSRAAISWGWFFACAAILFLLFIL